MILTPLPAWNFSLCSLDSSWPQEVVSVCVLYEALLRNVSIVLQCSVIFHAFSYSVTLWKACGLLQDLTDTIACLSISRFSKVACLIHNKWRLFTFVRLVWLNISIWDESILALSHLFVWLVQYTTQKWTNGQIRNQDMLIATTTSVHAMKSLLWFDIVAAYSKWQCWTISQSCMTGYWDGLDSTSTLWTDPQYIPQGPYPMSFPGVQKGQSACPPELMASIVITLVYPYTKCACTPASHPGRRVTVVWVPVVLVACVSWQLSEALSPDSPSVWTLWVCISYCKWSKGTHLSDRGAAIAPVGIHLLALDVN